MSQLPVTNTFTALSQMTRHQKLSVPNHTKQRNILTIVSAYGLAVPCCWTIPDGSMLLHCKVTDDDGSEAQCCKAEVGGCTPANWQHCTGSFIHFSRRASRDHSKIGNKATLSFMMSEIMMTIKSKNMVLCSGVLGRGSNPLQNSKVLTKLSQTLFRGKYIHNNLIRIWVSIIYKLSGTLD
jgi:hypothetical protein